MLRAYVCEYKHEEWICVVVAKNRQQAKALFHRDNPSGPHDNDYIDIRAHLAKGVVVPEDVTEPTLYDSCEPWNCTRWDYYPEICDRCELGKEKRREFVEDERVES